MRTERIVEMMSCLTKGACWVGLLCLMSGCASLTEYGKLQQRAQMNYSRGNLDAAVSDAAQSLRLNPTYERSILLIRTVFPNAVANHVDNIDAAKRSSDRFKWDKVVS